MTTPKKIVMGKVKQREILRNILIAIFGPRLKEEKERRMAWADKLARKEDPKFFELYADEVVRPYLEYSSSRDVTVRPAVNRRGKPITLPQHQEKHTSYTLRTPSFFNNTKGCCDSIGLHSYYDDTVYNHNRPSSVYVLKHSKEVINLTDAEAAEYWAFREVENVMQKDFDSLKSLIQTALAATRFIKDFYEQYPQFSHLAGEPAEFIPDAPLPVPTANSLMNAVEGMGLHIPSPLETQEAKDGSN